MKTHPLTHHLWWIFACLLLLTACGTTPTEEPLPDPEIVELPTETIPPVEPSPTIEPAVAIVNGEEISISVYQAHLARYQAAQAEDGTILATEAVETIVLDDLIIRLLLAQGARESGFVADESLVEERLAQLAGQVGDLDARLAALSYTPESFRSDLRLEIEAAWMRAQIAASIPESAEQVLARQVLLYTSFEAERLLNQLQNGTPFETIVVNNDPQRLGFLGWFPRGYTLDVQLEEAAFALQPGEYSQVIETSLGFHILEVLDYDPTRQLTPDARLTLQTKALQAWTDQKRNQSLIEIFLP